MLINIVKLTEKLKRDGFNLKHCDTEEMDSSIMEFLSDNGLFDAIYDEMVKTNQEVSDGTFDAE